MARRIQLRDKNRLGSGKRALAALVSFMMTAIIIIGAMTSKDASGIISAACRKSAECMSAVEDEKAANAAAITASSNANFYEAKVADLTTDIVAMQRKIADTEAQIK